MARIGIDLDGVLYPFDDAIRKYLHYRHQFDWKAMPAPEHWHFYEDWGLTREAFDWYCNTAVDDGYLFRVSEPYAGSHEAMWKLRSAGHSIHIVTARNFGLPGHVEKDTVAWLAKHELPYDTITFSHDKTVVRTDWFIDDKVDNFLALDKTWTIPVLMDQPWNQDAPVHCRRAKNMLDFAGMIVGTK